MEADKAKRIKNNNIKCFMIEAKSKKGQPFQNLSPTWEPASDSSYLKRTTKAKGNEQHQETRD